MTRGELIEKMAQMMCDELGYLWDGDPEDYEDYQVITEEYEPYDDRPSKQTLRRIASLMIDTIFDALQEPTEEMINESSGYIISYPENQYCVKDDARECWQAMLNASPLVKDGKGNEVNF